MLRFPSIPAYYAACGISGATKTTLEHLFNSIVKVPYGQADIDRFNKLLSSADVLANATFPTGGRIGERGVKIAESFAERINLLNLWPLWVQTPEPKAAAAPSAPLRMDVAGKSFCMTGESIIAPRKELQDRIRAAGGIIHDSVSSKTQFLIMADKESNTGKAKKARDAGTVLLNYEDVF
jgi:NAD-dependent DNA ligase